MDFRIRNIIHVNDRGCYLIGDDEEDASEITKRPRISSECVRRKLRESGKNGGRIEEGDRTQKMKKMREEWWRHRRTR